MSGKQSCLAVSIVFAAINCVPCIGVPVPPKVLASCSSFMAALWELYIGDGLHLISLGLRQGLNELKA